MTTDRKQVEIPAHILAFAKGSSWPCASEEEVLRHAENMVRYLAGDKRREEQLKWEVMLSWQQARIIRDALAEYETAIPEDAVELKNLREWFERGDVA